MLGGGSGSAGGADEVQSAGTLSFDIPAQPLDEALFAYTDATGIGVLVEDGLATGRRSAAVRGRFTPETALARLLNGTGLAFRYTLASAFTLVPAPTVLQGLPAPAPDDEVQQAYFHRVQTAVKQALCRRAQTLPGQYRLAVQLWIGASGAVLRSAFLGSSGSRDRDDDLSEMLNGLAIGGAARRPAAARDLGHPAAPSRGDARLRGNAGPGAPAVTEAGWAALRQLLVERYDDFRRAELGAAAVQAQIGLVQDLGREFGRAQPARQPSVQSPKAYLFRTALNVAADHHRQAESRRLNHLEIETLRGIADGALDPTKAVEARLEVGALEKALEELTPRRRAILIAARLEEVPHADIAARFGISTRMVDKELKQALLHCSQRLDKKLTRRFGPRGPETS